jgi:hypothetical protein
VRKAQKPANITAAVRVEEDCAAAGGKGRAGGGLVAIFHYHPRFRECGPRVAWGWFGKTKRQAKKTRRQAKELAEKHQKHHGH